MSQIHAPHLPAMGTEFLQRRDRLHMTMEVLAKEAGLNRDTVSAVEDGAGSPTSRKKLDAALTRLEQEAGLAPLGSQPSAAVPVEPHLIEFEVTGNFGVRVVVKGPVEDAAAIEESVIRLVRDMAPPEPQG